MMALIVATMIPGGAEPANPVAVGMQLVQLYGKPEALAIENDRAVKVQLTTAFAKSRELSESDAKLLFADGVFQRLAEGKAAMSVNDMQRVLERNAPASRAMLRAKLRAHADLLTTQFDMIEEAHRVRNAKFVDWLVENYKPDAPLSVIIICTGNTRRSMFGANMGNLAAGYFGMKVRFHSGGTDPDAFNPRTIRALKEIGFEIEPTGTEAERGSKGHPNPKYKVVWGDGMETLEFSKKYTDAVNPQKEFVAILVCSEADSSCPSVAGASLRLPVPYLDPKAFDGAAFEAAKYAERRDDIGRFMLAAMMQARRKLEIAGKIK